MPLLKKKQVSRRSSHDETRQAKKKHRRSNHPYSLPSHLQVRDRQGRQQHVRRELAPLFRRHLGVVSVRQGVVLEPSIGVEEVVFRDPKDADELFVVGCHDPRLGRLLRVQVHDGVDVFHRAEPFRPQLQLGGDLRGIILAQTKEEEDEEKTGGKTDSEDTRAQKYREWKSVGRNPAAVNACKCKF